MRRERREGEERLRWRGYEKGKREEIERIGRKASING